MPSHLLRHAHSLTAGASPWALALVDVGTAFWLVLYVLAIIQGLRDRTYVIPLVAISANFSWELIAAVYRVAPVRLWHIGDILWLGLDAVIVWTLLRYGPARQQIPEIRRGFYPIVLGTFAFSLIAQLTLEQALVDGYGFLDAYLISVLMSVLFFFLYFARRARDNVSYAIAWCKFFGNGLTSAGFVFLYRGLDGEQKSVLLLHVLCVTNCLLDAGYVLLLARSRRAAGGVLGAVSSSPSASAT